MRILFMGTAELACPCLTAVAKLPGHELVGVVTQPDRPKGRDLRPAPPPVKVTAEQLRLPVQQPVKLRDPAAVDAVRAVQPDLIIVVAYGQILPPNVLAIPPRGCINVHTSLLPRWRGASPIQQAILHGDPQTGVTTMYLVDQLDAGDIIFQRPVPIGPDDTGGALHDRLAQIGAALLVETVAAIEQGTAPRRAQDEALVTYARKISKDDGRIDWNKPAVEIERQVRAFDPWPGTFTLLGGTMLKIWKVQVVGEPAGAAGELRGDCVGTGAGGLRLVEVQPAGGKRMPFAAFRRGHPLGEQTVLA